MSDARKDDNGKLRYDLIPVYGLNELARVFTIGAKKYSDRNWEKGLQWGRIYAALQRHANAWWGGEEKDPVDGQLHLASVAWCAFALMEYAKTHAELDDRSKNSVVAKSNIPMWHVWTSEKLKQGTDPDEDTIYKEYRTWCSSEQCNCGVHKTGEYGGV